MENMANILNDYLKIGKSGSINSNIARYMLSNLNEIPWMRVADIAGACHVSSPSVIRFCRELGFEDFKDFKNVLRQERQWHITTKMETDNRNLTVGPGQYEENVKLWSGEIGRAVGYNLLHVDLDKIQEISRDITHYRHIYCIGNGLSAFFGEFLNMRLTFQQKALVSMRAPAPDTILSDDKETTLAILVTQYGNMLRSNPRIVDYLRKYCRKIWLVTQAPRTSINEKEFDRVLYLEHSDFSQINSHILLSTAEQIGQYCGKYYDETIK